MNMFILIIQLIDKHIDFGTQGLVVIWLYYIVILIAVLECYALQMTTDIQIMLFNWMRFMFAAKVLFQLSFRAFGEAFALLFGIRQSGMDSILKELKVKES